MYVASINDNKITKTVINNNVSRSNLATNCKVKLQPNKRTTR